MANGSQRAFLESTDIAELADARAGEIPRLSGPIAVSLNTLIPTDHFYRHLEAKLDLSFIREWVHELRRTRPPLDRPDRLLQLVMYFESIRSERHHCEPTGAMRRRSGFFPSGPIVLLRLIHPHRRSAGSPRTARRLSGRRICHQRCRLAESPRNRNGVRPADGSDRTGAGMTRGSLHRGGDCRPRRLAWFSTLHPCPANLARSAPTTSHFSGSTTSTLAQTPPSARRNSRRHARGFDC